MQQVVTASNKTNVQNSKLASSSPVIASDKLMYLGYHDHNIADNNGSPDKNTMGTKSVSTRGSSSSSSTSTDNGLTVQHKDRGISTSQVNINRNTDNVNNNFIFPFSYP
jgi:hypothetical protein